MRHVSQGQMTTLKSSHHHPCCIRVWRQLTAPEVVGCVALR